MTEEHEQPDWSQLPANPRGFFALPAEFERKELKRAYNRLIRMYKPEKHPNEFQKIRAAFEELDLELRYGYAAPTATHQSTDYQWNELAAEVTAPAESSAPVAKPRLPIHERIETESPQAVYRELADKADKDPYDYFALAILSDVVGDRKDQTQFARWLLEGLKAYPAEHGLLHMMRDYLREVEPSPLLAKLLVACSKAVPTDNFYPLTEPAWENLLREAEFSTCINTLKQCQANLRGIAISGQLIFMIRMLRFALWRDESDWKDRAIDFVEENYEQIPPHMEFELEILSAAHLYVSSRATFLNGDPIRQRIDQAMQSYFTLDQVDGDQAVLQCQLSLLDSTEELLTGFPADGSDHCADDVHAVGLDQRRGRPIATASNKPSRSEYQSLGRTLQPHCSSNVRRTHQGVRSARLALAAYSDLPTCCLRGSLYIVLAECILCVGS